MNKHSFFASAIILIATLFSSNKISAQWSQNGTSIYPTDLTKRIGIGTSTTTSAKLQFDNSVGNKITLFDHGNNVAYGFGINASNLCAYVPAGGQFSVRINGYNGAEKFIANSEGNVGLGSRIYPGMTGTEGGGYSLVHFKNGSSTTGGVVRASVGNSDFGDAPLQFQSSRLDISTNNTNRMSVELNGNIAIKRQLNVGDNTNNGVVDIGFAGAAGEGIGSKRTAGGNQYGLDLFTGFKSRLSITNGGKVLAQKQLNVGVEDLNNGTIDLAFGKDGSGEGIGSKRTAGGNQWGLDFYTNNGTKRMSITNSGNVGIGINSNLPTAKFEVNMLNPSGWNGNCKAARFVAPDNNYYLDLNTYIAASGNVGYQFSPNGNTGLCITTYGKVGIGVAQESQMPGSYKLYVADGILTEKVKVALKNTANWADYVFADDYKLLSLTEVEKYIHENKHLPGVPSAEELQKTGIVVATMYAILLEKIEELTLYVIGIQKENESLRKEVEAIKKAKN